MRISDWSSDVCSSDLHGGDDAGQRLQRADRAVELPSAVVGHDHAVHPGVDGTHGVVDVLDALEPDGARSEERRVGKECVSTCRYRCSPCHHKKNQYQLIVTHTNA